MHTQLTTETFLLQPSNSWRECGCRSERGGWKRRWWEQIKIKQIKTTTTTIFSPHSHKRSRNKPTTRTMLTDSSRTTPQSPRIPTTESVPNKTSTFLHLETISSLLFSIGWSEIGIGRRETRSRFLRLWISSEETKILDNLEVLEMSGEVKSLEFVFVFVIEVRKRKQQQQQKKKQPF